jgi:Ice-binding-like
MKWYKRSLLKHIVSVLVVSSLLSAAICTLVNHVKAVPLIMCNVNISCMSARSPIVVGSGTYPSLGTAANFSVLGATTVTNTGQTLLTSNLGVSSGSACTGFPDPCTAGSGILSGTIHIADAAAVQAAADAAAAYDFAGTQTCTTTYSTSTDIGGITLTPGVYCFSSSAGITGTLTLDAQNNTAATFIFRIGSTLTTASASKVVLINQAQPGKVLWQVGSSANLGTTTSFAGSIIAQTFITVMSAATSICGLYALNGAVTLDTNIIQACSSSPSCTLSSLPGSLLSLPQLF